MNNTPFIILSILFLIYILKEVRDNKLSINESFIWSLGAIGALILSSFPGLLDKIAKRIGVEYPPSLLFTICFLFMGIIIFKNSRRIAHLQEKVVVLAQEIAILKKDNNKK